MNKTFWILMGLLALGSAASAEEGRGTDIVVTSHEVSLDDATSRRKDERFTFYKDDQVAVDLNENGDPNMNMQF